MKENRFIEVMRGHSDEILLEIVNDKRDEYQKEAIEAAVMVLNERGVSYKMLSDDEYFKKNEGEVPFVEKIYCSNNWIRLVEFIIDYFVIVVIRTLLVSLPMGVTMISFVDAIDYTFSFWVGILIFIFYYYLMEMYFGKTIGKMCFGLVVVNFEGKKPDNLTIFIRTICRLIPFDGLSFIIGGWFNHELKSNWHDRFSDTYVVYEKKLQSANEPNSD